jgi:DNA-binding response OmpR family regulator
MTTVEPDILIVNTDARSRRQVRQTLEQNGFSKLSEAESGSAAIDILNRMAIDILITDIPLQDLDGWRLTRLVRSGVLRTAADTPIVMVSTTYSERIAEITAREFRVDRFISFEELQTAQAFSGPPPILRSSWSPQPTVNALQKSPPGSSG